MPHAIEGSDGCIRVTIPSDVCELYNITGGDEIIFVSNGHGVEAQTGDLVVKIDRRSRKRK